MAVDRESLASFLSLGLSLEEIGRRVGKHPSTVSYWVKKHGLAISHVRHRKKGAIPEDLLRTLVAEGLSVRAIAARTGRSTNTVRYWLGRHSLVTARAQRIRDNREGRSQGLAMVRRICRRHGETDFWLEGRGYYRCMKCRWENVAASRLRTRLLLIEEAGGRCAICSYDAYAGALQFHHVDPAEKSFELSIGCMRSLEAMRAEAHKCALLCANCHAEVEAGVARLPFQVAAASADHPG
jgi:transposase